MADRIYHAPFTCTGKSALSILAESLLNHLGRGRFRADPAGSRPKGQGHPTSLAILEELKVPAAGVRGTGWEELATPGAPPLDFVFTACDQAAGEACLVWPGQPLTAHWGLPDPAAVEGSSNQQRKAFLAAAATLDRLAIRHGVRHVGRR